jgi:hypothetical protein
MSDRGTPPAGWYPDPSGSRERRYWDGSGWTEHLSATTAPVGPDPQRDLEELRTSGRRAKIAILVAVPIYAIAPAVQGYQVRETRRALDDLRHQITEIESGSPTGRTTTSTQPYTPPASTTLSSLTSLPTLVIGIIFLIWFHRAASVAARLGRPARRSPGWAVGGWLIPIGNFFLPYQSARDIFRPDERRGRSLVTRWWASYLIAGLVNLPLGLVAGFNEHAEVWIAAGAFAVVVWLFAALNAVTLIEDANSSVSGELQRLTP